MPRVKRRIFAGAVCEQQVYTISDRAKSIKKAKPKKPRFKSEAEREKFIITAACSMLAPMRELPFIWAVERVHTASTSTWYLMA